MNTDDRDTIPPSADDDEATAFSRIEGKLDKVLTILSDIFAEQQRQAGVLREHEERIAYLGDTDPSELNGHTDG